MNYNTMLHESDKTLNHEGAQAWTMTPEVELYTAVVTYLLEDSFYEDSNQRIERIAELVGQVSPEFVAQLAIYARKEMHLRSVPLLLLVLLAMTHNGDSLVSRTVPRVVLRADEITELLACYQFLNGQEQQGGKSRGAPQKGLNRLSRQLQEGLKTAFNNFDEYQFAKYDRQSQEIKLRDALFLVHPKAKDEAQQEIFNRIANGTLTTPYTWETELSALGQQHFDSEEQKLREFTSKWEELIASGKLGYMALLRNLRNILQCKDISADAIRSVCSRLSDPAAVAKARQFPFRYLSAYREIIKMGGCMHSAEVLAALEEACRASASHITGFGRDTSVLLACDVSGSMYDPISIHSSVQQYDIGFMLAMLLHGRLERVVSGIFGDVWQPMALPTGNILANVLEMQRYMNDVGFSTNGYKVIQWLNEQRLAVDKVMMFTDCQMWNSCQEGRTLVREWHRYKSIAPDAKLYLFDLSGYGSSPLSLTERDVHLVGGWSDRVFDMLDAVDNGVSAVSAIQRIEV